MSWWTTPQQLDDDQQAVIAEEPGKSVVLSGPPGSGKTNLLVLRANYLLKQGVRAIQVLSFTRNLRLFLSFGAARYNLSGAFVSTYSAWARRVLREHGMSLPDLTTDFEEARRELVAGLRQVAANRTTPLMDYLLLDEAQDYTADEIEVLLALTKYVYAVGDANQQIYQGRTGFETLRQRVGNIKELRYHYRSASRICRIADSIMGVAVTPNALESSAHYDEQNLPSSVVAYGGLDLTQQINRVIDELPSQLTAYPDEPIAILSPTRAAIRATVEQLSASSIAGSVQALTSDDDVDAIDRKRRVLVSTVHAAKGLEFRCVHVVAGEQFRSFGESQRRLSYTAVTRAQTSLRLYHDGPLPSYLATAISEYYPRMSPGGIGAAFQ